MKSNNHLPSASSVVPGASSPVLVDDQELSDDADEDNPLVSIGAEYLPSTPPTTMAPFEVLSSPVIVCRRDSVSGIFRERSFEHNARRSIDDTEAKTASKESPDLSATKKMFDKYHLSPMDDINLRRSMERSEELRKSISRRSLGSERGRRSVDIEMSVYGQQGGGTTLRSSFEMMKAAVGEPLVVRGLQSAEEGMEIFLPSDVPARQYSVTIGDAVILQVNAQKRESVVAAEEPLQPLVEPTTSSEKTQKRLRPASAERIFATAQDPHIVEHWKEVNFKQTAALSIGALGVVYGDIGTNMLFLLPSIMTDTPTRDEILGLVSLIIWLLLFVVGLKYGVFILQADNHGEGGCFALLFQVISHLKTNKFDFTFVRIACIGAGLLIGDGVVTPSISILSAVEGIVIHSPALHPAVLPITCVIILVLFQAQRFGTQKVGFTFGPIMLIWFLAIGSIGISHIVNAPEILLSFNPKYAVTYLVQLEFDGFALMGTIVLCVCGAEAMFADLAHFGSRAIRISWWVLVCPALFCCYLGQGALLLVQPELYANPFYNGVPLPVFWPMIILATLATVIASQAMISAAFSLTSQAVNLGYFPPLEIIHTNPRIAGQIYIPFVNNVIMILCLIIVLAFKTSAALSSAYGLAVSGDMLLTTCVFFFVMILAWKWPIWKAIIVLLSFLMVDIFFATSALMKVPTGGFIPLSIAVVVFFFMQIWIFGSQKVHKISALQGTDVKLEDFMATIMPTLVRPQSDAVFLTTTTSGVPIILTEYIKHAHVLPTTVHVLVFQVHKVPQIPDDEKINIESFGFGMRRIIVNFGFMERRLTLDDALELARTNHRLNIERSQTSFWLFRQEILPYPNSSIFNKIMVSAYNLICGNLTSAASRLQFPLSRTVELSRMDYV